MYISLHIRIYITIIYITYFPHSYRDARTGLCVQTLYGHNNSINHIQITNRGDTIVSCDADGIVKAWDIRMISEIGSINLGTYAVNKLAIDQAGKTVLAACDNGMIKAINLLNMSIISIPNIQPGPPPIPTTATPSTKPTTNNTHNTNTTSNTGSNNKNKSASSSSVQCIAFNSNDDMILSGSSDAYINLWSTSAVTNAV